MRRKDDAQPSFDFEAPTVRQPLVYAPSARQALVDAIRDDVKRLAQCSDRRERSLLEERIAEKRRRFQETYSA